jgi:hypothetical protein
MSLYKTIEVYNTHLINNQVNINIIDFVKEVNKFKFQIDIDFIDEFVELVSKDECCIHHNMLQKYSISNLKGGTGDIKKLLEQNEFIENEDFELRKVSELRSQGGTSIKNEYYLHPRAFKICLMRSLKTKKYAKYYLLLEECIKYFNDYQIELNKKYIVKLKNKIDKKDNKIYSLEEKMDKILENNKETNIKYDKILEDNKETKIMNEKLLLANKETNKINEELLRRSKKSEKHDRKMKQHIEDITINLDDIKEELTESNTKLNHACKKLDIAVEDRVPKPDNHNKLEDFILLKSKNKRALYKYYAIRGQTAYVDRKSKKKITNDNYLELYRINNVANSINLWNRLKEKLKNKVEYCGNELDLIEINKLELLDNIKLVYEKRKDVILSLNDDLEKIYEFF